MPRRKAMMIAGATLGAPALAAAILALIGAAGGGGDQAGLGSLSGAQGLQGSTAPAAPSPPKEAKQKQLPKEQSGEPKVTAPEPWARVHRSEAPTPARGPGQAEDEPGPGARDHRSERAGGAEHDLIVVEQR